MLSPPNNHNLSKYSNKYTILLLKYHWNTQQKYQTVLLTFYWLNNKKRIPTTPAATFLGLDHLNTKEERRYF